STTSPAAIWLIGISGSGRMLFMPRRPWPGTGNRWANARKSGGKQASADDSRLLGNPGIIVIEVGRGYAPDNPRRCMAAAVGAVAPTYSQPLADNCTLLAAAGHGAGGGFHLGLRARSEQRARRRLPAEEGVHAIEHRAGDAALVGRVDQAAFFLRVGDERGFH